MIRCDRVRIERGGVMVVDGVTLDVPAGGAVALVGPTGAGKTSLLAAAATVVPLHGGDGDITIAGGSVRREPSRVRRLLGYVPDRPPGWPGLRADAFLEMFATAAGLAGGPRRAAVDRALALAGLAADRGQPLDALPAGRGKLLLLARALLHDPAVLLLDDPFGGLDPRERGEVARIIEDFQLLGRSVLAAIDDAAVPGCFSHVAVLAEGRLVAAGPNAATAFAAGRTWRVRIDCPAGAEAAAAALAGRVADLQVVDADTVIGRHDPSRGAFADVVATLVREGIAVGGAGYDPPWTAQLLPSGD